MLSLEVLRHHARNVAGQRGTAHHKHRQLVPPATTKLMSNAVFKGKTKKSKINESRPCASVVFGEFLVLVGCVVLQPEVDQRRVVLEGLHQLHAAYDTNTHTRKK